MDIPSALSWAHAARDAARRGTIPRLAAKFSRKSRRQVTRSMDGQDRMHRSERRSFGPKEKKQTYILNTVHYFYMVDVQKQRQ